MLKKLRSKAQNKLGSWILQSLFNKNTLDKINELVSLLNDYEMSASDLGIVLESLRVGDALDNSLQIEQDQAYIVNSSDLNDKTNNVFSWAVSGSSSFITFGNHLIVSNETDYVVSYSSTPDGASTDSAYTLWNASVFSPQLSRLRQDNSGALYFESSNSFDYSTKTELMKLTSSDLTIDSQTKVNIGRDVTSGTVGVEVGASGGTNNLFMDFGYGGVSGQDYIFRLFFIASDGRLAFLKRSDPSTLGSAAVNQFQFYNDYANFPVGVTFTEQASTPSTPANTNQVLLYFTTTKGKIRAVYDDGSVYEWTGVLIP